MQEEDAINAAFDAAEESVKSGLRGMRFEVTRDYD